MPLHLCLLILPLLHLPLLLTLLSHGGDQEWQAETNLGLGKRKKKEENGRGRCEVGMLGKNGWKEKKRNAHCTFQMDGK